MKISVSIRAAFCATAAFALTACGTTYDLPTISETASNKASLIFSEESDPATAKSGRQLSKRAAIRQFLKVVERVEPVAEEFCRRETQQEADFNCNVEVVVDTEMPGRNAYQTRLADGTPVIGFTVDMILDARNADELAFVMGHEYGHHVGRHIQKAEEQALAGALVMGVLMAAAQAGSAGSPYYDQYQAQQGVEDAMELGFAVGQSSFSQSYELESDVIGTYIAEGAGYDPVKGARFFARPESMKSEAGQLSFWGTHPPDELRVATVIATSDRISERRNE